MTRLLLALALLVVGCDTSDHQYFIDQGMLCYEEGDPDSQIGTALVCEVLP
jgi:hypothetical protein